MFYARKESSSANKLISNSYISKIINSWPLKMLLKMKQRSSRDLITSRAHI